MYKYLSTSMVLRESDGVSIPIDPANLDYRAYQAWAALGNTATPYTPDTPPPAQFTPLDFLDLFTQDEQLAVVLAGMQNAAVKLWYDRALAAQFITIADPRTEGGLSALVSGGLLTAERKAEIVGAML